MDPTALPVPVILTRCLLKDVPEVLAGFGIHDAAVMALNSESLPAGEGEGIAAIVARGDLVTNYDDEAMEGFGKALSRLSGNASRLVLIVHAGAGKQADTLAGNFEDMAGILNEPARGVWIRLTEGPVVDYSSGGAGDMRKIGDFINEWAVYLKRGDTDHAQARLTRLRKVLDSQSGSGSRELTQKVASTLEEKVGPVTQRLRTFTSVMHDAMGPLTQLTLGFQVWAEEIREGEQTSGEEMKRGLALWQKVHDKLASEVRAAIAAPKRDQFDQTLREKFEADVARNFERMLRAAAHGDFEEAKKGLANVSENALRRWASELVASLEQYRG